MYFFIYLALIFLNYELIFMMINDEECNFSKKCNIKFNTYVDHYRQHIACYDFNYLFELNNFCGDYQDIGTIKFNTNKRQLLDKKFNLVGIKISFEKDHKTKKNTFFCFIPKFKRNRSEFI